MAKITINGISLDPDQEARALDAFGLSSVDASASNYVIVQTDQPLNAQKKAELANAGATIIEYAPENAYICRFDDTNLSPLRALPFVTWVNTYLKNFKIDRQLLAQDSSAPMGAAMALSADAEPSVGELQPVDIVLHRDVDIQTVQNKIAAVAGLDPESLASSGRKIRANLDGERLARVAEIDEVRHIEKVFKPTLANDVAGRIMRVDAVHNANHGYTGDGQIVAVCDSGFDRGSTTNVHPAFGQRVKQLYALGRDKSNDPHGHGTHVAGSILGDGVVQGYGALRGTAPSASLVLQSVSDNHGGMGGLPIDLRYLFFPPYSKDGARVHNNSWGAESSNGRYSQSSHEVDDFVWTHRDMVICIAAGNPGRDANANGVIDLGSVSAPGTAKNCVTVGASESHRPAIAKPWGKAFPARFPAEPIHSDLWADNPDGMAAFSGRGPTSDGRIKPDIVAPGTSILSVHSRDANVHPSWGPSPDPAYCYMSGTSMATPLVSGCAAVIREFLIKSRNLQTPSAALVKAMLINGAVDISGQYIPSEAGPAPNFAEGFGRVDLQNTLLLDAPASLELFDEGRELDTGDEDAFTRDIPEGASSIKVTLVWTDPPGDTLQNDLDLIVRSDGQERHGNVPPGNAGFDRTNNVEQVVWDRDLPDRIEVIVRAHRVVSVPAQSYALVLRIV